MDTRAKVAEVEEIRDIDLLNMTKQGNSGVASKMRRTKIPSGSTSTQRKNLATSSDVRSQTKLQSEMISRRDKRSLLQRRPRRILTSRMSST